MASIYMEPCRDYESGYDVIDARTDQTLAWRHNAGTAAEIVDYLTETYGEILPAPDTLVHEIIGLRITGVAG
jgi:hypothetical protein